MVKVINIDTKTRTIRIDNADSDIKTWRTTESGTHFPIKKGESTKEALDKFVKSKHDKSRDKIVKDFRAGKTNKDQLADKLDILAARENPNDPVLAKRATEAKKQEESPAMRAAREASERMSGLKLAIGDKKNGVKKEPERDWQRGDDEDEDAYYARRDKTLAEARKLDKVSDWYGKAYKGDSFGKPKNKNITFKELADGLLSGKIGDFYEAVGTGESDVREKIFQELSERTGRPYDDFYDAWLHGGQKGTPARKAKAVEDYKKYNKMLDQPLSPDVKKLVLAARDRAKKEAGEINETDQEIAHRLTRDYPETFGFDD